MNSISDHVEADDWARIGFFLSTGGIGVSKELCYGMKPDKPAVPASEHVRRDSWDQLALSLGYRQHYRVGIAIPIDLAAGRAFELGSGSFEGQLDSLEVVFSPVSFHKS